MARKKAFNRETRDLKISVLGHKTVMQLSDVSNRTAMQNNLAKMRLS